MVFRATELNGISLDVIIDKKSSSGVFQAVKVRKMGRNQPRDLKIVLCPGTDEERILKVASDCVKCMGRALLSGR